ncbi:hypothetical protein B0H63DRAFT_476133 [Podospora didyma]|uniref:MARVEL domain-containing protein n=1 Tax=Podospora didyma TaxID=330526 RepID=A0AAE0TW10_9PEZI|nr:hypothetical protein B0H63DRAFT_476133 [Podospora didyma]
MAWETSTWLALIRLFQLTGAVAASGLNGFLTVKIYVGHLGLTQVMVILEMLVILLFIYTTVSLFIQHTGQRSERKSWLICSIVFDVIFCAFALSMVSVLAYSGLPLHCGGLTRLFPGMDPNTPRFGDGDAGTRGELDKFCGLEQSFYIIALSFVFTYIATIVLTVLRIFENSYTKTSKMNEVLDSLDRANDIEGKMCDFSTPISSTPTLATPPPPPPPSEGIISRSNSLSSNMTASTFFSQGVPGLNHRPSIIPRRPVGQPLVARPPMPTIQSSMSSQFHTHPPSAGLGLGFVPIPLDEDSAEAALVADGMQHEQRQQQQQREQQQQQQQFRLPRLPEDQAAESALVSDGMRPSEPMLPPYYPRGGNEMSGHSSNESNDMRLSDYIKGGTRAQDMKDSGRY